MSKLFVFAPCSLLASLSFASLWFFVISEQTLFFAAHRSCWFYDANLGEHSLSEQLTLACYAVAGLLCMASIRRHGHQAYRWLLLLIIVCFLEEANYGQVFWTAEPLFFDRDQLAWHTSQTLDDTLHLDEVLSALVFVGLPVGLRWHHAGRSREGLAALSAALAVPLALYVFLGCLVGDWSARLDWQAGRFLCGPYPEELLETLLAASLAYSLFISHLFLRGRPAVVAWQSGGAP